MKYPRDKIAQKEASPKSSYRSYEDPPTNEERSQMWNRLKAEFTRIGIKKILIDGTELYIAKKEEQEHGGCIGAAISKLEDLFEIEFSLLTWPEGRGDIKK